MLQGLAVDSKARLVKQSPTYYIFDIVKSFFQSINIIKLSSGKNETLVSWTIKDGAVGRIGHLQTRPAPSGQADPQPPARCEDRHPPEKAVAAQKKTGGARTTPTPRPRPIASLSGTGHTARREEDAKNKKKEPTCNLTWECFRIESAVFL